VIVELFKASDERLPSSEGEVRAADASMTGGGGRGRR
jgi:hypothetical protein